MGINKRVGLFIILITLLLPAKLIAAGNQEIGLPKVDRLIKERNYNQAIIELATYMNEKPEDFDGAQRRIRRIITMRETYNDKAVELLLVLANEPTNDEKKLAMITYMESLEKNPNKSTQNFILDTKAAAQFTYYRAKFDQIMNDGNALIDKALYVEAARKFTEGYVFYKNEFDDETDPELLSKVNGNLGGIISAIGSFAGIQITLDAAVTECESAIAAGDIPRTEAAYTALDAQMAQLSRFRNQVADNGWFFEDSFAVIKKTNPLVAENSFLPFAQRFTLGRKAANRYEGVLGAIDAEWNTAMNRMETATNTTIRSEWQEAYTALNSGDVPRSSSVLQTATRYTVLARNFAPAAARFTSHPGSYGIRDYPLTIKQYTGLATLIAALSNLGTRYSDYLAIQTRMAGYTEQAALGDRIRKAPSETVGTYNGFIADLGKLSKIIQDTSVAIAALPEYPGYTVELSAWQRQFADTLTGDQLVVYRKSALFQEKSTGTMVGEWQGLSTDANRMLDGIPKEGSSVVLYYPAESVASFTKLRAGITADRKAILSALAILKAAPETVRNDPQYTQSISNMEASLASLDALFGAAATGIAKANNRILQANLARQESDLRYSQAVLALRNADFQSARDNLQRSREKINQALALQDSVALRTDSDAKLEKLGADITRIENEAVVRDVRAMIVSGKNNYYIGNFDQAEQTFIQAKNRWAVTNIVSNVEVANWLDIINTALSMKTGRTIPVSAPLYPQMSQILSSANQLYAEGKNLMALGKRAEAVALLTQAETKLQQLQLVYPLNQDAGQLKLKIDQVIDPFTFNTFFRQKVDYIRANYRTEKQTSYSDLLDLYQINPAYPGIKKLVDEVEIYLGIQIPPPDPKALAQSSNLTRSAQKIYDSQTRSQFQVALNQLDEAIKLNPDNQTAIMLKDRIQTAQGGQSVAVLSRDDEEKYQIAVQELQKGNKLTAAALVEQLIQNPKSRNSAKVQDLKKRIDSLL